MLEISQCFCWICKGCIIDVWESSLKVGEFYSHLIFAIPTTIAILLNYMVTSISITIGLTTYVVYLLMV